MLLRQMKTAVVVVVAVVVDVAAAAVVDNYCAYVTVADAREDSLN